MNICAFPTVFLTRRNGQDLLNFPAYPPTVDQLNLNKSEFPLT